MSKIRKLLSFGRVATSYKGRGQTTRDTKLSTMLTDEICEFLTSGVSIALASRNAAFEPSIVRAKGCRIVRSDQFRIRVLVSAAHAGELLEDVRATAMVSATFTMPNTHRTLQFKGKDASVVELDAEDRAIMERYPHNFSLSVGPLGFNEEFVRAFFASSPDEVAVEFTPSDAFQQTPGPAAGTRLA